jgi:hypothetical protein
MRLRTRPRPAVFSFIPSNNTSIFFDWLLTPVENRSEKTGTKLEKTGISGENWADLGKKGADSGQLGFSI